MLGYIEKGKAEGARLVTGGGVPAHLPKGFFVEPTLFGDVDNGMTIAREEIFGPVLVFIPHDGDDDGPHRQRLAVRAVGDDHVRRPRAGQGRRPPDPHRHARHQRRRVVRRRRTVRRLQGLRSRPPVRIEGLEIFTETKTVGWPAGL